MYKISKTFKFETAHRLSLNQSKCRNIHGHSYTIEIGVKSEFLNSEGMVIDFGILKNIVEECLNEIDHSLILNNTDHPIRDALQELMPDIRIVTTDYEPTAENMAKDIYYKINTKLIVNYTAKMDYVTIWETDTSKATYC